ncbi:MAG: ATP-binding protein [Alphaproteobacteria bacterium]|nr:ATP-binding protein [Alphaproteobacteria bacterium]MBF0392519.1 ATP-binding protein [Alphaproteobacteria bacterium]
MDDDTRMDGGGSDGWRPVGTVVGNAGTGEFTFILRQFQARVGDIVALGMEVPDGSYREQTRIYVWARITDIRRFNPFFPFEAAQEIASEGLSLEDTVLSGTRDQLEAKALILGATAETRLSTLFPLTYPVKPASTVFHPPSEAVRQLLMGGRESERSVRIGSLIARTDVEVTLSAPRLVARHLAILAMTGGGKTVAARRIIRELIGHGYPLLILDPHGDYIGLWKCRETLQEEAPGCDIRLFYPDLLMQQGGEGLIEKIIGQMTDGLSEPQADYLRSAFNSMPAKEGEPAIDYIERLILRTDSDVASQNDKRQIPTIYATRRSLRIVRDRLSGMRKTSEAMRSSPKLKGLAFEPLPNPFSQPEKIIRPGQVSVLYLGGYDHVTQCSIAAITLETLFEFRANLTERIAPFLTVVEEAHTFIPSAREGTQDAVSLRVVRRMITEGRKFGTGLMLISQRPSRLDETIISQCNSFLILRLVNPKDQTFVRAIMENLTESDARMIPGFGPGQGIVSGQVVRFPLPVSVRMDDDLLASEIGDEDFFEKVENWKPDSKAEARKVVEDSVARVNANRKKAAAVVKATPVGIVAKTAAALKAGMPKSRGRPPKP